MSTLASDSLGKSWFGSHIRFLLTRYDSVSLSLKSCMFYHWYCSYVRQAWLCTTPHWPVMFLLVSNLTAVCGVWLKHSYDNTAKAESRPGCQDIRMYGLHRVSQLTAYFYLWNFGIWLLLGFCFFGFCFCLFLLLLFVGGFLPFETHSPEYTWITNISLKDKL